MVPGTTFCGTTFCGLGVESHARPPFEVVSVYPIAYRVGALEGGPRTGSTGRTMCRQPARSVGVTDRGFLRRARDLKAAAPSASELHSRDNSAPVDPSEAEVPEFDRALMGARDEITRRHEKGEGRAVSRVAASLPDGETPNRSWLPQRRSCGLSEAVREDRPEE